MRISDWSSDVCSSDLLAEPRLALGQRVGSGAAARLGSIDQLGECRALFRQRHRDAGQSLDLGCGRRQALLQLGQMGLGLVGAARPGRSEEHTSELQSLMRISYAVFCLKKKKTKHTRKSTNHKKAPTESHYE